MPLLQSQPSLLKRSGRYCATCYKARPACICVWLKPQKTRLATFIIQHPDEQLKPIGTARIAELGLDKVKLTVGLEHSSESILKTLKSLGANKPALLYSQAFPSSPVHYVLDFERFDSNRFEFNNSASVDNSAFIDNPTIIDESILANVDSLILLDGTWRNTREILLLNDWLKLLPVISLKGVGESQYKIRKAQTAGALATIEALAKVIMVMDKSVSLPDFLRPFEKMIEYQISRMGEDTFRKNYLE